MKNKNNYNIILVTLDGLRQDKVNQCPTLKSQTETSIYFPKMFTVSPYTFAAHHAIFSGMYPSRNGVDAYYHILDFKKDEITTLPQLLQKSGYFTCCDIIDDTVIPDLGFDEYNIFDEKTVDFHSRHKSLIEKVSKKGKFFLFLHYTELHKEIVKDVIAKYKDRENDDDYFISQDENNRRYDSCLPSCDLYVSTVLDTVNKLGLENNTITIFFSDHGMSLGEKKGEKFYGVYVYDYTINVFATIKIPNKEPRIIHNQCKTIDLFPTIAELAGISLENETKLQGESLLSLIDSKDKEREVFVETGGLYGPWPSPYKHNVFCIRQNNKKLIFNDTPQTWEFYNLQEDSKELNNIYDEKSAEIRAFKEKLIFYLKNNNIETNLT